MNAADKPSGDFQGPPLTVGSVRGLRSFRTDSRGRLTGVTATSSVFRPGVNTATCRLYQLVVSGLIQAPSQSELVQKDHRAGAAGCSCGYWAYYDGSNMYSASSEGALSGVIEGTGQVTLGTRGFRAEKARLLALIAPLSTGKREAAVALGIYERAGIPIYASEREALQAFPIVNPTDDGNGYPEDEPGFWDAPALPPEEGVAWGWGNLAFNTPVGQPSPTSQGTRLWAATTTSQGTRLWAATNAVCGCPLCK